MRSQWDPIILDAVERASQRAARTVHQDLREGVYDLATIACIAPWIGMLFTALTLNDLPGYDGPAYGLWRLVFTHRATSLAFSAFGLGVGLIGYWSYWYLSDSLAGLDAEMENASLELLNQLGRFPGRFVIDSTLETPAAPPVREERFFRPFLLIAAAATFLDFLVQCVRFDLLSACFYTPFMLATCCVFLYPFWSRLLRRPPGVLFALASVCTLAWSVTEAILRTSLP